MQSLKISDGTVSRSKGGGALARAPRRAQLGLQAPPGASARPGTLVLCAAARSVNARTEALRELLGGDAIIKGPCCHDALSARLIERAGFDYAFMSGFCTAAARLGAPDTGLISYAEMVDQGRYIHEATESLPIIGDGDTGYGNAMNVKRTVRGYSAAGFAGILIEDQVSPKSCGHVKGKRVVGRQEAVSRVKAACDARDEGADIVVVARTDARQAVSLEEALWRAQAFAEAGADVLFIDALGSVEEMQAFCDLGGAAANVPKMANMLEGGGKTPILSPAELEEMGFGLVAYPLSVLGVAVRAMELALGGLKDGRIPSTGFMPTFGELQEAVGFPEYFEEEARYALSDAEATSRPEAPAEEPQKASPGAMSAAAAASAAAASFAAAGPSAASAQGEGEAAEKSSEAAPKSAEAAQKSAEAAQKSEEAVEAAKEPEDTDARPTGKETPEDLAERLVKELQDALGDAADDPSVAGALEDSLMDALTEGAKSADGEEEGEDEATSSTAVEADAVILPDDTPSGVYRTGRRTEGANVPRSDSPSSNGRSTAESASSDSASADSAGTASAGAASEAPPSGPTELTIPVEPPSRSENVADYTLKIKITDTRSGRVKLESNLPGGWVKSMTSFIPEVADIQLEQLVKAALGKEWTPGEPVVDFVNDGTRIQVFLIGDMTNMGRN